LDGEVVRRWLFAIRENMNAPWQPCGKGKVVHFTLLAIADDLGVIREYNPEVKALH
jgi:hypothetical protein